MLISATLLNNAIQNYKTYKTNKENYGSNMVSGMSTGMLAFFIAIAIIFFVLEILLLFYAINIAIKCTSPGPERVVHVVLAVLFTAPYLLLNIFFGKCGNALLKSYSPPSNSYSNSYSNSFNSY